MLTGVTPVQGVSVWVYDVRAGAVPGTYPYAVFGLGSELQSITLTVVPQAATAGLPPAPLPPSSEQSLPMPESGNCADITNDAEYAYGTGLTGGWQKRWADWARGWACGRTLAYSSAVRVWVID